MSTASVQKSDTAAERQIVAFRLAEETYGIDIAQVHTVITPQTITSIPRSPSYIKGVINLRGKIIPVVDMRARFGLPPASPECARDSRIVIVEAEGISAGLIVDAVSEVLRLREDCIDPPSQLMTSIESDCVISIGRVPTSRRRADDSKRAGEIKEDRLVILLSVWKTIAGSAADSESLNNIQATV